MDQGMIDKRKGEMKGGKQGAERPIGMAGGGRKNPHASPKK